MNQFFNQLISDKHITYCTVAVLEHSTLIYAYYIPALFELSLK